MSDTRDLQPCPFCGLNDGCVMGDESAYVDCRACGATGPKVYHREIARATNGAIAAWNRRASPADVLIDAERLDWLLPNLHPANFGLDYDAELLDRDEAGYLAAWRAAIDSAMKAKP